MERCSTVTWSEMSVQEFRRSYVLTCGDVDVCDIHGAIQSLNRDYIAQDVSKVVQSHGVCDL